MTLELKIKGQAMPDYSSASVSMSMETLAHRFAFSYSDKWLQTRVLKLPFVELDACTIELDGATIVDGYIDDIPIDYSATSHTIGVAGKSWTGHLVESSAVFKTGSWRNVDLLTLCQDICKDFGIKVTTDIWGLPYLGGPFKKWAIEGEETAHGFILRVLKERGLYVHSNGAREIVITRAAAVPLPGALPIVFGVNTLQGSRSSRFCDRHSYYLVKSQDAGEDDYHATDVAGPFFNVDDPQVPMHRPLVIVSDGSGKQGDLESRAKWELTTRAGRSRRLRYTLQGLTAPGGAAWKINTLIPVKDTLLDIAEPLLIVAVDLSVDARGGSRSSIELAHPDSFDVAKPPIKKPRKTGGGKLNG